MKKRMRVLRWGVCLASVLALLLMTGGVRRRQDIENVYSHKENGEMKIALTFDDGPHPKWTPYVLDVLRRNGVPGTFFVVGECAGCYPDLIRREIAEGHEIGNHTYSHMALYPDNLSQMAEEIRRTEETVYEIAEYRTRLFRPPEGLCSKAIASLAAAGDYSVILWNIDTRDWAHTASDRIVSTVLASIEPGDILLFHDGIPGASHTPEALAVIIPKLKAEGYRFVTVSELLGSN